MTQFPPFNHAWYGIGFARYQAKVVGNLVNRNSKYRAANAEY